MAVIILLESFYWQKCFLWQCPCKQLIPFLARFDKPKNLQDVLDQIPEDTAEINGGQSNTNGGHENLNEGPMGAVQINGESADPAGHSALV